jgi:hypothetical protein
MQIKKDTKVKVRYRPELGIGTVLQVAEASGGEYNVDVVFDEAHHLSRKIYGKKIDVTQNYRCAALENKGEKAAEKENGRK